MDTQDREKLTGRLAMNFAQLETWVAIAIWQLLNADQDIGWGVTVGRPIAFQLRLLKVLGEARITDPETMALLKEVLTKAELARRKRNDVLHSGWFTSDRFPEDLPADSVAVLSTGSLSEAPLPGLRAS